MNVTWQLNGIFNADAQKVYEEIGNSSCTPQEVLNKARSNPNGELYKCFEWDDSVAAEKFRLEQARKVIQFLVVRPETEEAPKARVFQISSEKTVYQPAKYFMQNPDEYQKLMDRAKNELIAFESRYKSITELENVFEAIDEFIKET